MRSVLVTGATGFIGSNCLEFLATHDCEVHAVSSRPAKASTGSVRWHQTDLTDAAQAEQLIARLRPSHLLHLAWFTTPGTYWTAPENVLWLRASLAIMESFIRHGGERVVMAGTCAEYDWNYGYCSENLTPLSPGTLYGSCKHALQIALDATARGAGVSSAWGRLFFVYGPNEHPDRLVPSVIRSLLQGTPARCSHGNQIRDFLHVRDAAGAFVALLASDVRGPVNIGSGKPVALRDLIFSIANKLDGSGLVELGAVPALLREPPLLVADVRLLTNEVGWRPKIDLNAGVCQSIEWWRERIQQP